MNDIFLLFFLPVCYYFVKLEVTLHDCVQQNMINVRALLFCIYICIHTTFSAQQLITSLVTADVYYMMQENLSRNNIYKRYTFSFKGTSSQGQGCVCSNKQMCVLRYCHYFYLLFLRSQQSNKISAVTVLFLKFHLNLS